MKSAFSTLVSFDYHSLVWIRTTITTRCFKSLKLTTHANDEIIIFAFRGIPALFALNIGTVASLWLVSFLPVRIFQRNF